MVKQSPVKHNHFRSIDRMLSRAFHAGGQMTKSSILILVLSLFLVACQTNQLRAYERVQTGMDKHQVLEIMGSPTNSARWNGLDRWRYRFFHDEQPHSKELCR
jgi:outer membrane protein assembly factor BamE (lipoprotein component of BamABCDE complex)